MAWEDVDDEEHELLEAVGSPARQAHYNAMGRGLLYFAMIVLGLAIIALAAFIIVYAVMMQG